MYDFNFCGAERDFAVMQFQYPEHPLPYFFSSNWLFGRIEN